MSAAEHVVAAPGARSARVAAMPRVTSHLRTALRGPAVPLVLAGTALAAFTAQGLARYFSYHSGAYDLGFFEQVVEQTSQGHPFQTSFLDHSFLGQHWEPVLAVWAPLDRVVATPVWLLLVTSVALAAAPVFGWRLARAWLGRGWAAPIAALACVIDPLIVRGAAFDYHSEVLTPALALAALDGAARGHRWRFLLPAAALGLVKEDALLVAAGVAWIVWCVERRGDALALLGGSLVAFGAVVGVIMPGLGGGSRGDLSGLYAYLGGDTPGAAATGALTHPDRVARQLTSAPALRGCAAALVPLTLLPLFAGRALLAVAPVLLVALLSASAWQSQLLLQYGLEAFPLLLACALLGWRSIRRWHVMRESTLAGAVLLTLAGGFILGSPLPGGIHADASDFSGLDRRAAVDAVLTRIPAGAAVSASTGLVPHLAARAQVYEFPDRAFEEPYVVLDDDGPRASWTLREWARDEGALPQHGYRVVASAGGVTLWTR